MVLNENTYREVINSYTRKDWQPLLDLIPRIENTKSFGNEVGGGMDDNGAYHLPNWSSSEIVHEFLKIVYDIPIVIDFHWAAWDGGRAIASDETFDFDTIDIPTKCKLITAFVRNDRFCEGALASAFEKGIMLKILKSIQKQVQER